MILKNEKCFIEIKDILSVTNDGLSECIENKGILFNSFEEFENGIFDVDFPDEATRNDEYCFGVGAKYFKYFVHYDNVKWLNK